MTARTVKLLHVEDELLQQRLVAHHLASIPDLKFSICCVASEDDAIEQYARDQAEMVILDYHLKQGDGLNCLRRLRQSDRVVPILAISGVATPEIAADLLHAGADDYIGKADMTSDLFCRSVRECLTRADTWRKRLARNRDDAKRLKDAVEELSLRLFEQTGSLFIKQMDEFDNALRVDSFSVVQLTSLLEDLKKKHSSTSLQRFCDEVLRPVLRERIRETASGSDGLLTEERPDGIELRRGHGPDSGGWRAPTRQP